MNFVKWLLARLREPSTFAALSGLLLSLGVNVSDTLMQSIAAGLGALAGIIGVILSEKASG